MKVGSIVRSHYRAGWFGEVVDIEKRKNTHALVTVKTICTADGRPHRKPYMKRYSAYWLEEAELPSRYPELKLRAQRDKWRAQYRARTRRM